MYNIQIYNKVSLARLLFDGCHNVRCLVLALCEPLALLHPLPQGGFGDVLEGVNILN